MPMKVLFKNQKISSINILAFILIFLFGISGVYSLHYFGISWDEGLGNLFFGERYLLFFQTQQEKFLDFKANLSYHSTTGLNLFLSPLRGMPYQHPPIIDVPSAWIMHMFSYGLGWLDPVAAFHVLKVFITVLFLFVIYVFFRKRLGNMVSFWALLFLVSFPRLWGDMQINPKDIPSLAIFTFFICSYIYWYEKPGWKRAILVGICFGLGLGNKANILFAPLVILIGWFPWRWQGKFWTEVLVHIKQTWFYYLSFGLVSVGIYLCTWPYLYNHPERIFQYFRSMATQGDRVIQYIWSIEPFAHMAATMPEIMLIFLLIGILCSKKLSKNFKYPWVRLFLVWFILPIFRISMPGQINFDGIRHYYEFLPAAAILAGFGVYIFGTWIEKWFVNIYKIAPYIIGILIVGIGFLNFKNYFPYTYIYYNQLFGGITGAARYFSENDTTDYWAVSYREGLNWINIHAEPNSSIYVPVASWLVEIPEKIWIRKDLKVINNENSDSVKVQSNSVYVMFINRPGYYNSIAADLRRSNQLPVYQSVVAGKPILFIYQINPVTIQ